MATPNAVSNPGSTVTASIIGGQSSPSSDARIRARVFSSAPRAVFIADTSCRADTVSWVLSWASMRCSSNISRCSWAYSKAARAASKSASACTTDSASGLWDSNSARWASISWLRSFKRSIRASSSRNRLLKTFR